jgi:hypothetical protein
VTDAFAAWLRKNPAPDLQDLVRRYGGYDKIPSTAWIDWDQRVADWRARYRDQHLETSHARTAANGLRNPLQRRQLP